WLPPTQSSYDDLGHVVSTTDPGGHTTQFSYGDTWSGATCGIGNGTYAFLTQTTAPSTTNSQGAPVQHRAQTTYFPCSGLKQSSRDENDIVANRTGTVYTHELMHRPKTAT